MCKKLFIAATGQHCGKTTISLSLMHLARQRFARVGYIKPIGPKCQTFGGVVADKDAVLMAQVFGLEDRIALMSPLVLGSGATRKFLDGELHREWAAEQISRKNASPINPTHCAPVPAPVKLIRDSL